VDRYTYQHADMLEHNTKLGKTAAKGKAVRPISRAWNSLYRHLLCRLRREEQRLWRKKMRIPERWLGQPGTAASRS